MIIAVDFDGTLCIGGKPNVSLIQTLLNEQKRRNQIVLWTCREGKSLREALNFLRKYGFIPNYVNQNSPLAIQIMGHDSRKVYADVYIDDKNCRL